MNKNNIHGTTISPVKELLSIDSKEIKIFIEIKEFFINFSIFFSDLNS